MLRLMIQAPRQCQSQINLLVVLVLIKQPDIQIGHETKVISQNQFGHFLDKVLGDISIQIFFGFDNLERDVNIFLRNLITHHIIP